MSHHNSAHSIDRNMDDWIVVDTRVLSSACAAESNETPVAIEAKESAASPSLKTKNDVLSPNLDASMPSFPEKLRIEQPTFGFNDMLRSVNDFQRAGLGLYDLYTDQLQTRFHELKEAAANSSRWALDKARAETQRMMATLSATEVSEYLARTSAELSSKTRLSAIMEDYDSAGGDKYKYDVSDLEADIGARLVGTLCKTKVPLYDGCDFKEWFSQARPYFDSAIPEQTIEAIVCGVKLYSLPSVAATIDGIDFTGLSSRDDVVDFLTDYFLQRRIRSQKYYDLLQSNIQS